MPPWRSRLLTVMFPPAVETGQRDAPGHEKISPSELVTGGPEGEAGDLGKRKRDVAGAEETVPDRKHRRREEEAVSSRTSR